MSGLATPDVASRPRRVIAAPVRGLAWVVAACPAQRGAAPRAGAPLPEVVVRSDDLGRRDVGACGQDVARTPRLDAPAA